MYTQARTAQYINFYAQAQAKNKAQKIQQAQAQLKTQTAQLMQAQSKHSIINALHSIKSTLENLTMLINTQAQTRTRVNIVIEYNCALYNIYKALEDFTAQKLSNAKKALANINATF